MHKKTRLPRTSRVNEKILEYYMKFGQERDLERFMRLYSPSGCRSGSRSRSTTTTTTASSNASDDEGRVMRRLFLHDTEISTEFTKASSSSAATDGTTAPSVERRIPIRLECGAGRIEKSNIESEVPSSQDAHTTPKKTQQTESKHTQTPESIAKSHKRLEWDSLGDVGYKKSMSASNISILERSVLKEFFQESGRIATNVSEGDLKQLQMELQHEHVYRKPTGPVERSHNKCHTPPLASSTMMCMVTTKQAVGGARPKQTSQSTSTSLQKKFEKPVPTTSREVQVTLSSASTTSSALGGSATPSSFDYFPSRSSRSQSTAASTDGAVAGSKCPANQSRPLKHAQQQQQQPHSFVAGISEMLARRKALGEHNDRVGAPQSNGDATDLQQLHDTLKQALTENKENSSTSSLLHSPQLDLGIQLLCSLIDARSLDHKQKKKLVRDIVKRISRMNACGESEISRLPGGTVSGAYALTPSSSSVASKESGITIPDNKMQMTLTSKSTVTMARTRHNISVNALDMQALERNLPSTVNSVETNSSATEECSENIAVLQKPSPPTTSVKALEKLAALKAATKTKQQTSRQIAAGSSQRYQDVSKLASRNSTNAASSIDEPVLNEVFRTQTQPPAGRADFVCSENSESPSTSSKDVTTQKAAHAANHSDTDADVAVQSTMGEWLNPMTQSEIEYEEKKREFAKHAAKRECLLKRMHGEKTDAERETQLQWIQKEIERLESLRHLLLKPETQSSSVEADVQSPAAEQVSNTEKIYDTVCSDKSSSALSGSAERLVQEIEVVIEESNEDFVDLAEKLKRSKQRRRETQTVYEKPNDPVAADYGSLLQGKPRFRTVTETIITNEEQVSPGSAVEEQTSKDALIPPPPPPPPPRVIPLQRSKMKTPPDSNDSESVGSFVQQRKREFMEQYRNRKRNHYESLLQQQQHLLIQQQQQIIQQLQQRPPQPPTINGHYSVPHTMFRSYQPMQPQPTQQYYQPYFPHYSQPQPPAPAPVPTTMPSKPVRTVNSQRAQTSTCYEKKQVIVHATYSSSAGLTSEQQPEQGTSSSSMFCMSSEVSVPMGTNDSTSSTSTTTHQYDDVAGGVAPTKGVQTGSSLRGVRPIFGSRLGCACCVPPQRQCYNRLPVSFGQSGCLQVKPKAVAYVIQFDKSTTGDDDSSSREPVAVGGNEAAANIDNATNAKIGGKELPSVPPEPEPEPEPMLTLQDHLKRARPEFLAHTKERKAILNRIQAMRQERERELRDIVDNASISSLDNRLQRLPPPPTKRLRIFPTKVMKAMTHKYVEKLPEVVEKQEREREERRRRGNRLLRDIFNRRLQKRVRSGKLSINHSRQVI